MASAKWPKFAITWQIVSLTGPSIFSHYICLKAVKSAKFRTETCAFVEYAGKHMCKYRSQLKRLAHTRGGTQLWVGYGCAAQSFDHHPIAKPEKMQICKLCLNHLFCEGPFFKTNQYFLPCKLACKSTFWQPMGKRKEQFIEN